MAEVSSTVALWPLTGATRDFMIPYEYLARKYIQVTLKGTGVTPDLRLELLEDYRFTGKNQITLNRVWSPSDGYDSIELRRVTSATDRLVNFSDGSILRAYDLNTSQIQAIHIAEESRDLSNQALIHDLVGWDAEGKRILNVGGPQLPTDAATKEYVDAQSGMDGQYLERQLDRTVRGPEGEVLTPLIPAASRASKMLGFDALGQPTVFVPVAGSAAAVLIDLANETDLSKGASMVGRGAVTVASVVSFQFVPRKETTTYLVKGYWGLHPGQGGGYFRWSPTTPRSEHNGGSVISPTVPWNGTTATHTAFLKGTGETSPAGVGCFVRKHRGYHNVTEFGAISDWKAGIGFGTGFDNRDIIKHMMELLNEPVNVPKWGTGYGVCSVTNINLNGVSDSTIYGHGKLVKMGVKGIFSTEACTNIHIATLEMDLQLEADEAAGGSILDASRPSTNYSFAVSLARTHKSSVRGTRVRNCSWDAIVAQGRVDSGGGSATQSVDVVFDGNTVENVRGSMLWQRAILKGAMTNNYCRNDVTFAQKANSIFVVDWCEDIEVSGNQCYNIGDNVVGVGEPVTDNPAGRNKNIRVINNYSNRSRYHSILIAQGQDCIVSGNILLNGGVQGEMPGHTGRVLCGTIMVLGGGSQPTNHRVIVEGNVIRNAYELGIYVVDRGTASDSGSTHIVIRNNIVSDTARPAFVGERKGQAGIYLKVVDTVIVDGNNVTNSLGDGILVYGDALITNNTSDRNGKHGIHVPSDTLMMNRRLSGAIAGNVCRFNMTNGIHVWGKDHLILHGNTALGNGRGGEPGTEETIAGATNRAGIAVISVTNVSSTGNEARGNGGPGVLYRSVQVIKDTNSFFEANGDKFTSGSYKSGCYVEGASTLKTKATFITPISLSGGIQVHPIRGLNTDPQSVILDPTFVGHSAGIIGLVEKSLFNIP